MKSARTILVLVALASTGATAAPTAGTRKLTVNGMVCAFCAQGIEKRLTALPETQAVYVNLGRKIVAVQAKEGRTLDDTRLKHEVSEAGYDVIRIEPSTQTVEAIREELRARK
jgi:copper chaperone CopZ